MYFLALEDRELLQWQLQEFSLSLPPPLSLAEMRDERWCISLTLSWREEETVYCHCRSFLFLEGTTYCHSSSSSLSLRHRIFLSLLKIQDLSLSLSWRHMIFLILLKTQKLPLSFEDTGPSSLALKHRIFLSFKETLCCHSMTFLSLLKTQDCALSLSLLIFLEDTLYYHWRIFFSL